MKVTLRIEGMMCHHCEARVKKIAEGFDFVQTAEVSFEKGSATLTLKADGDIDAVAAAISADGYAVNEIIK